MAKYQIEDGIELPAACCGRKGESKYPFKDMIIGQSFMVTGEPEMLKKIRNSVTASSRRIEGKKFAIRTIREEPTGIRVWRVQ